MTSTSEPASGRRRTGERLCLLLLIALEASCLPSSDVRIASAGFLERVRLDRNGLTAAQRADCMVDCERPGEGTFRTTSDHLVAEIHPAPFDVGSPNLLPLSDCLWIAHSSTNGRNTDAIIFHWEGFATIDRTVADGRRVSPESETLSACRLTDPVDRQPVCWGDPDEFGEICPPLGPATGNVPSVDSAALFDGVPALNVPSEGRWEVLDGDLYIAGAILRESARAQPPAPGDYGNCDASPIVGAPESWVTSGFKGFDGPSTVDGKVSLCTGLGFRMLPNRDATYRVTCDAAFLGPTGTGSDCAINGHWLKPNVMVVEGSRRMARRALPDAAAPRLVRWSTPIGGGHGRWQENFTPNVVVSSLRFFRLSKGVEVPLEAADFSGPLCIRENLACLATCTGTSVAGRGLVFDPFDPATCNAGELTPTYAVAPFGNGVQPGRPLTWEVLLARQTSDPVYIDFDLRTVGSPPALLAEPPATDFDKLQVGTERQGVVTVSNVGGQTLRIQSVSIQGPWSADFRRRLPTAKQLLPLPIEAVPLVGATVRVGAAADFEELPLAELIEHEAGADGRGTLLLREVDHDGAELLAYGETLAFDGRLASYDNPRANFQATANPAPPTGTSPIGYARRPVGRPVYRDRVLPFNLLPGQAFDVVVTAEPAATGYDHTATLRVDAVQASNPSVAVNVQVALSVDSISGPTAYFLPQYLNLPRPHNGYRSWQSSFLLVNDGETGMLRTQVQLAGPHAARFQLVSAHPPSRTIAPGDAEHFTIQYDPSPCGAQATHQAEVRVTTNGGQVLVPLTGDAQPCP